MGNCVEASTASPDPPIGDKTSDAPHRWMDQFITSDQACPYNAELLKEIYGENFGVYRAVVGYERQPTDETALSFAEGDRVLLLRMYVSAF
jgi:hypothetical protein